MGLCAACPRVHPVSSSGRIVRDAHYHCLLSLVLAFIPSLLQAALYVSVMQTPAIVSTVLLP
jgi:hypothetical protein